MSRNLQSPSRERPVDRGNLVPFPASVSHRAPRVPAHLHTDNEDAAFDMLAGALGRLWRFRDALDVGGARLDPMAREDGAWFRTVLNDSVMSLGILLTGACGSELIDEVSTEIRDREARLEAIRVALLNRVDPNLRRTLTEAESASSANRETIRAEAVRQMLRDIGPELAIDHGPDVPGEMIRDVASLVGLIEQELTEQYDHQEIPSRRGLRALLRGLPAFGLDAMAAGHGISDGGRRRDRERLIVERLSDTQELAWLLEALDAPTVSLLGWLVEGGGLVTLRAYEAKFGPYEAEVWWGHMPPRSPVGRLRLLGLVWLGHHQGEPVLVVPAEVVMRHGAR